MNDLHSVNLWGGRGGGGRGGLQSVKGSFVLTQADHPNCSRDLDVT